MIGFILRKSLEKVEPASSSFSSLHKQTLQGQKFLKKVLAKNFMESYI